MPDSYLRRRGVDGRDEPGHDGRGWETQSAIGGPTRNAISDAAGFSEQMSWRRTAWMAGTSPAMTGEVWNRNRQWPDQQFSL
jgi:hypothetical protein